MLQVREPSKPIDAMPVADIDNVQIEESKDNKGDQDEEVFFEAEDGQLTQKPHPENFAILENIEKQLQ